MKALDPDKIDAYGPFLLVRRLPVHLESKDGTALPADQMTKNIWCEVLSVGKGEDVRGRHVHSGCKPGDIVAVRQYDGRQLYIDKWVRLIHQDVLEAGVVDRPWAYRQEAT